MLVLRGASSSLCAGYDLTDCGADRAREFAHLIKKLGVGDTSCKRDER